MSRAARLAGALLVLLVSLPLAARAEAPPQPPPSGNVVQELASQQKLPLPARKKKKPHFQTRFFSE